MGRIVLLMSISLDGFFEGPGGALDWQRVDDELHRHFNERIARMSAFLNGRVLFERMAAFWPTADQDPASTPLMAEYARIWRDMPKYVFSRALQHADWNATLVRDVVPAEIRALADRSPGDLALGGANLAATFLRHELVDEFRIYVHPVVIGRGRPLFSPDARLKLRLLETQTFGNGVVLVRYGRGEG
jgi:dihydrofolate reductase